MTLAKFTINKKNVVYTAVKKNVAPKSLSILNDLCIAIEEVVDCNEDIVAPFVFMVCIHSSSDLVDDPSKKNHYMFGQEYFEGRSIDMKDFFPIIHVLREDIVNEKNDVKKKIKFRYANVIESSIWNFRIIYKKYNYGRVFGNSDLTTILRCISDYTSRKIYELCVAREYAELNARMTRQAYLEESITKVGTKSGGHFQFVSPFTFHSEREIYELIKEEFDDSFCISQNVDNETKSVIKRHKWRVLLVDDKSHEPMKNAFGKSYHGNEHIWDNKTKIIKGILSSFFQDGFNVECSTVDNYLGDDVSLLIEYVSNKSEAIEILKRRKYDIILLDYLLENGSQTPDYGHDILNEIADNKMLRNELRIGPRGKFYFLFISAYSSAIRERLLADGLNYNESYWQINVGACPINTPQLFLYNIIQVMKRRLEESGILKLSSDEIYRLVGNIYRPMESDMKWGSVRKRANDLYQEVLSLQYHYRSILKDVEIPVSSNSKLFSTNGSVLMTDFIQKKVNLGGMLEHLTQLVHLTAFGTVRQWPEMWEEYVYFKALFEKQMDRVCTDDYKCFFQNIEDYIMKLKNQQQ